MFAAGSLLLLAACTTEEIVMVTVSSVEVIPEAVSAVEGEQVQLVATVLDERSEPVSATGIAWRSDDPAIASVDSRGVVDAHATGSVAIRATFQGVSGATDVRVLRGPFVEVAQSAVTLFAAPGAPSPPDSVAVTNGGAGTLEGLAADVRHRDGQPADWLQADLTSNVAPAQLRLTVRSEALASGMYDAAVRVSSTSSSDTATVAVALSVAGFEVRETDGGTTARESGGSDELAVVLSARPAGVVVLSVSSSDPGEVSVSPGSLRFAPGSWSAPQSVTVRGVDDGEDDGDRQATVIVSVDVGQSHDAFEGLDDQTVTVVNADDDDPAVAAIVVRETGRDTRVRESGASDTILVSLATRPTSNVALSPTSENPSEVSIESAGLITFTPSNWNVQQPVVVRAVDDLADDGDRNVTVTLSVVSFLSAAPYQGRSARVTVRSIDNDRGRRGGRDDEDDDDEDDDDDGGGGGGGRGGRGGG